MNADIGTGSLGKRLAFSYVRKTDEICLVLTAIGIVGVPALFAIGIASGELVKVAAVGLSARLFWTCSFIAVGAVIAWILIGESLRILKYQRPQGELTVDALASILGQVDATVAKKLKVILFCIVTHLLLISATSAVGALLAKKFVIGT